MRRQLALNSASTTALLVWSVVVSFVMSPLIIRSIGDVHYGIWEQLSGLIGYLSLLDLGISPAVVRFVAVARAEQSVTRLRQVVSTAFFFLLCAGLCAAAVVALLTLAPGALFNIPPSEATPLALVIPLTAVNLFLSISGASLIGYLYGLQRHLLVNILRLLTSAAGNVAAYLALTHNPGRGLVWLALTTAVSQCILYSVLYAYVVRTSYTVLSTRFCSRTILRELWRFGVKNLLLMLASRIRKQSMPILIAHVAGVDRVIFYAVPNRLVESAGGLGAALGFPLTPHFSAYHGHGDAEGLRASWYTLSRVLQFVLLGIAVLVIALGPTFVARWIGAAYAREGLVPIVFLSTTLIFEALAPNSTALLVSQGRHGPAAKVAMCCALINIVLAVPLTMAAGVSGAALALFVTGSGSALLTMRLACRSLGITLGDHLRRTVLRLVIPLAVLIATLVGLILIRKPTGYLAVSAYSLFAAVVYACSAWRFALGRDERSLCRAAVRSGLHRLAPRSPRL